MTLDLKTGDPWPFQSSRGIVGKPCAPVWHALVTTPQKEAETAKRLEKAGCEVQYPTFERSRHVCGKKKIFEVPVIPRIIYARFSYAPQWDVMKARRVVQGVFSQYGRPVSLSADDIAVVMGLPTEAERLQADALEASRPKAGGRALITVGPFSGFFVDVSRVEFGRVWWEMAGGIKGEAPMAAMRAAE